MNFAILTVMYNDTKEGYETNMRAFDYFPKEAEQVCIINKSFETPDIDNVRFIKNDENCLARAWNIGLKEIFKKYDFVVVSGLDSMAPPLHLIQQLVDLNKNNPTYGFTAGVALGVQINRYSVEHGDGSFSFYCISKECFEKVGDFDERYKPAYFEDNDYLERMWKAGYKPQKDNFVVYHHMFQGTVKQSPELQKQYAEFMNRNLAIFKKDYKKVPDHLPKNIIFH